VVLEILETRVIPATLEQQVIKVILEQPEIAELRVV
jgi:hypothetical protein